MNTRANTRSVFPLPAAEPAQGYEKGALAREQLILHATRIFAAKGYAAAATREICQAAGVNIAAIHYYFGGKEGLYRAVLTRPIHAFAEQFGGFDDAALPFEQAMRRLLAPFVRMALDDNDYDLQVIWPTCWPDTAGWPGRTRTSTSSPSRWSPWPTTTASRARSCECWLRTCCRAPTPGNAFSIGLSVTASRWWRTSRRGADPHPTVRAAVRSIRGRPR
jgi:AcrR family transcriptional regulator